MSADLVLKNARVITLDSGKPTAELVAMEEDKIVMVGGNDDLGLTKGIGTSVIDCEGKAVVPGLNDAHCHTFSLVRKLLSLDLSPASVRSIDDIKEAIALRAKDTPPGQWIVGTDYNDFYLAERRHPNRWDIDEVTSDYPVVLCHRSLHACVLNSLALSLAGITRETPEPSGALIDRELTSGEPSGLLFEMLGYIREKVMPPLSEVDLDRGISIANEHYLSMGITSLQEATVVNSLNQWRKFSSFKEAGKLKSRVYLMPGIDSLGEFQQAGLAFGSGDDQLRVGAAKIIPNEATGQLHPAQPELNRMALNAHRAGFQLAIHAVQHSLVEAAIIALEYVHGQSPESNRRHRIEHCSECSPDLLERLKKIKTMVVTQPPFVYYSGERYLAKVPPERFQWLYRIRSMLNNGLVVAASSDSPVVPDSPLVGIYAAVTRQAESGQYILPEESISAAQALALYTLNGAYASFEEDIKGSIAEGKLADMVVLSDDPIEVLPEKINDIKVEKTIIGGEVVWEA
jgi:predicted amidohydrolase YtcJ